MDKITIIPANYANIKIEAEPSVLNELYDHFAYFAPGYKFMPAHRNKLWDGKIRLFDMKKQMLPAGLLKYLLEFCDVRDYEIEYKPNQWYPSAFLDTVKSDEDTEGALNYIKSLPLSNAKGKKIELHKHQENAISYAIKYNKCLLISPTASGKSLIIYSIIRYYLDKDNKDNKPILIVVPTTSLVEQLASDFADYSMHDETFDSENSIHKIYSGKDKNTNKDIVITTWQSIYKMGSSFLSKFGAVIGDEAHTFKAKSLNSIMLNLTEAKYRIGTTGTLDNNKVHHMTLEGLFGPIYKVITTNELMEQGKLANLNINMFVLKYPTEITSCFSKKIDYQKEIDFIVTNEKRNNFIANLAIAQKSNTMVLFQLVEKQGKPLFEIIKKKAGNNRNVYFISGATDAAQREQIREHVQNDKNAIMVCSFGTCSTGINIPNMENIIFASPSKSQIKVLQSIGRALRISSDGNTNAMLYDLTDDLSRKQYKNHTLKHGADRLSIYQKEKFKFKLININM